MPQLNMSERGMSQSYSDIGVELQLPTPPRIIQHQQPHPAQNMNGGDHGRQTYKKTQR